MLTRRHFLLTTAGLTLLSPVARALSAGQDYLVVQPPLTTHDPKRVEVLEFFWYGCPHCFALEPDLSAWVKTLPKYAYFRRVPAVFPQTTHWVPMARAYYAAEMLGVADKLHADIFNAIHLSGQDLNNKEVLLNFVEKMGVNRKQFAAALDSPEVKARVAKSQSLSVASGIQGVPALVVDGKYQTSITQTGTPEKLFSTLNDLIALAEQNKKH